jgi:hypothetical protein
MQSRFAPGVETGAQDYDMAAAIGDSREMAFIFGVDLFKNRSH